MLRVPRPSITRMDVASSCISQVQDLGLRQEYMGIRSYLVDCAVAYAEAAANCTLYSFPRVDKIGNVIDKKHMSQLYQRLVTPSGNSRKKYDMLIASAPNGRCPLCTIGTATSLDHHLPKSEFSQLAVTPDNLVPACDDCQGLKLSKYPTSAETQTLHPYFDDFESEGWLAARIVESKPASAVFFVRAPATWPAVRVDRATHHLEMFGLNKLFGAHAANELVNVRHRLNGLLASGGISAVKLHLEGEAASRRAASLNSWQTAMYDACVASVWYYQGGFALV